MGFIYFILGVVFTAWSIYEIFQEESTLIQTYFKEDNPKKYWAQLILTLLLGLTFLVIYFI